MMKRPGKCLIPLRMIPWEEDFTFVAGQVMFGCNDLCLTWIKGEPMPSDTVPRIVGALEQAKKKAQEPTEKKPKPAGPRKKSPKALEDIRKQRAEATWLERCFCQLDMCMCMCMCGCWCA